MNGWQIALIIGIGVISGAAVITVGVIAVWLIYMFRVVASGALETDESETE